MEYTHVVVAVDHIVYFKPRRKQAAHQVSTQCPTGAQVNQKEYLFLYFKKMALMDKGIMQAGNTRYSCKVIKGEQRTQVN